MPTITTSPAAAENLTMTMENVRVVNAVSPRVSFSKVEGGTQVTIEDVDGIHTAVIPDGEQGAQGEAGPKGDKGDKGDTGEQGIQGVQGPQGEKGEKGDTGATGPQGIQGVRGEKGDTGYTGATGPQGTPGQDGISPSISVTDITDGHRVTITDATGSHSFDVMDGEDGQSGVQDVQVNGTSVVTNGVANVPVAGTNDAPNGVGVVGINSTYGISINTAQPGRYLYLNPASNDEVKAGTVSYKAVAPYKQHVSAFYGLAKASGDTTQSASSNPVGQYTESAKSAISTMLNGSISVTGTTPTINALPGVRYVCGEVTTLDITTPESGIVDVVFTSGSTPTVLTVTPPTGMTMKWANGFDPTSLEEDTVYEINVMNGCLGVAGQWS